MATRDFDEKHDCGCPFVLCKKKNIKKRSETINIEKPHQIPHNSEFVPAKISLSNC